MNEQETVQTDHASVPPASTDRQRPTEDQVLEALKNVFDPELGINIVDLGLVYDVKTSTGRRRRHPVLAHHDGMPDRSR